MKALTFICLAGLAGMSVTAAAAAELGPVVEAAELNAVLKEQEPIILDIRGEAYAEGHIEGAVSAPYALFRGPAENPGQLLPEDELEATYEELGLEMDRPIVIMSQGDTNSDFGAAARVYWTLKSSGFSELSVLNGGTAAWADAGLPLSKSPVRVTPSELDITWDNRWTALTDDVADVVAGDRDAVLVDARPPEFYEGKKAHNAAERPGTVPGAQNLSHSSFFRPDATAISGVDDVDALKASLGIGEGDEVVSFCNTGHWAATDWFALSELAGIDNVKLYPGSMVEYSASGNEMANVPGLLENLLNQFRRN
ncbi:sulfurtransferase [Paracoccus saliphilus]|uniref:Sulfurtransferase n=1 Tax=Paracoccus saliphilus TaxID=405559 RepID=A0AA45W5Y8_9RHOB|nr:rhodanese-like domain-containing protein [Paracoccus saliphilus]WCR05656.1 sulfurtransferase [Paracoccus saliphilus]SIS96865.1 thiosulfate/3-mercaptopyruvate sulfurtransferase [Paracoccus saliphilus]